MKNEKWEMGNGKWEMGNGIKMKKICPQCHIVPLLGEGNHKGLPLHYITVCRGNPTCKALNFQVLILNF